MDRSDDASADTALDTEAPRTGGSAAAEVTGYALGDVLGRGGMGEVVLARDSRLDRDVALKRMRPDAVTPETRERFLREVLIQARLDHPSIVPVHDIGIDAAGRPYFTMKRLAGTTLAEVLARGDTKLQRLLRAFVDVCHAIELAHERRIVHRDLKPANIMLGNYGEVYVLDWGVARLLANITTLTGREDLTSDATQVGTVIGTPGYMAPEQNRGEPAGPAADVYALGAILFEIVAGEPLRAAASTSPAVRRPDRMIPPELDAICIDALVDDPLARPSARELADRVQQYLDGDRDLERRRTRAAEELAAARAALAGGSPTARETAIRHAGRALGLDVDTPGAAELLTSLVVEPPPQLPPALRDRLAQRDRENTAVRARRALLIQSVVCASLAVVPLLQVNSWRWVIGLYLMMAATLVHLALLAKRGYAHYAVPFTINLIGAVIWSRFAGPFVLWPTLFCAAVMGMSANFRMQARPQVYVAWCVLAMAASYGLEWIGVFEPSWAISGGALASYSQMLVIDGRAAAFGLVFANILAMLAVAGFTFGVMRASRATQRTLEIQKWHLEQLLPRSA